jgi:hypothetical protein
MVLLAFNGGYVVAVNFLIVFINDVKNIVRLIQSSSSSLFCYELAFCSSVSFSLSVSSS